MSLSPAFLDELRARTSLSALIGKTTKLAKAGREMRGCCPFHNEKTPSFYVNDDKGFYHCFGCSAHGDAIRWMTDQRGLPFIDAVKELAQAAGLEMPAMDRAALERDQRAKGLHEVMADAAAWFAEQLNGIAGAEARAVLAARGVSAETARIFGLGFAPDSRGKLRTALREYGDPLLVEAGLLIQVEGKDPYDRFRGRLMIPIRDPRGRVIAFGGRVIGEGEPKYLNSPDTPLFDKGRTLYNLDRAAPAARKAARVLVVEGYMDVIALAQAGIGEVVAPLGTALTEAQIERLWRLADVPLICLDGDAAGQKAALRAAHRALPMLAPDKSLAFVTLPDGRDPDDLVRAHGHAAMEPLIAAAQHLVDRIWQAETASIQPLSTPEQRAGLGARLRGYAKEIKDSDVRSQYLATFNRMVWDYFHPERTTDSFRQFKRAGAPKQAVSSRLLNIAKYGIDQATIMPALMKGLLHYPDMVAPLAETLARLPMNSKALRQMREEMLDAALHDDALESEKLIADMRRAGLQPVLRGMEDVTLAFSFLAHNADPATARADMALLAEKLDVGPALDAELKEAKDRYTDHWDDVYFGEYTRLLKVRQRMERMFMDALRPEDGPMAYEGN